MKGIYLGAFKAAHYDYDIDYQDINGKRDIGGDMMSVDLSNYDYVIATPPCNFWSRAAGSRQPSQYALDTAHLLPDIIDKLIKLDKPFLVENVINRPKMLKYGVLNKPCFVYFIGRHTYWTNILFNVDVEQRQDFVHGGRTIIYDDMLDSSHQGGFNVHNVVESFLESVYTFLNAK